MRKFRKPKCPYCGKKLSLPNTWLLKKQGEYICPKCGGISNIVLDRSIYPFAFVAVILGSVFFIISFINIVEFSIWMLLLVILPFFLFFLISVFLVRLKKPVVRNVKTPPRGYGSAGQRKISAAANRDSARGLRR